MKRLCLAVVPLLLAASATKAAPAKLETEDQKVIYALGLAVASNLAGFNLTAAEIDIMKAGLSDALANATPQVPLEEYGPKIQELARTRAMAAAQAESKEAEKFLAKAAAEKGAVKSDSGLVFVPVKAGTGASPAPTDTVKVHYHGTLRDGSVFDSSVERKEPATFGLNQVIPCWTEGVQKLKVGGKAKLYCPAAIAYGDRGAPPKIKPGSALAFEVELLEIVKPATP